MNKLRFSKAARDDLAEIKRYITEELGNPSAATATVKKIMAEIRILQSHAMAGASLSAITDIRSDYRYLVSGHYLIFYRVQGDEVYIDRVLYGRRNYLRVLFSEEMDSSM